MYDRERVMKELSWLINNFPLQKDPKDAADKMCNAINTYCSDAISLLKEQEPRVMTLEEVEEMAGKSDPDPVCAEWSTGRTGWVVGSIHLVAAMMKNGNRDIRVWTSRPTPEQMRDTPWEGEENHEK